MADLPPPTPEKLLMDVLQAVEYEGMEDVERGIASLMNHLRKGGRWPKVETDEFLDEDGGTATIGVPA